MRGNRVNNAFDEIYDPRNRVRKHYRDTHKHWRSLSHKETRRIHRASKKMFHGDYPLDSLPRILTQSQFTHISKGVRQRANAILLFLCDYFRGQNQWKTVLPVSTLKCILGEQTDSLRKLNPTTLAFPYGPDIIRDSQGNWRVVEDSAGCLGGIGDLLESRKILLASVPAYRGLVKRANNPLLFYKQLATHYKAKARSRGGLPLLFLQDFDHEPDHETERLASIFQSFGIGVATDTTTSFFADKDSLYLKKNKSIERVGYLILHVGPEHLDQRRLWLEIGKMFKRPNRGPRTTSFDSLSHLQFQSIQRAILDNKVLTNFSPGSQFVNNKMFGLFVDRLIGLYLKQEPMLRSIPARSLAYRNRHGNWVADRALICKVLRRKDEFVVKLVDEDGGSGVWIGQKLTRQQFENLKPSILESPTKYIAQKFSHLSVLGGRIVDLRLHAHVSYDEIIVSNTPWGRANWLEGDGKVNIGQSGFISPVFVQ